MKATAIAHPIQGLVKYHGMRDSDLRLPYHNSISVCTAPSHTKTTVEFNSGVNSDTFVVDGSELRGRAAERVQVVVDRIRSLSVHDYVDEPVRLESENNFPSNVGLGSSSSGFAAATRALGDAAELPHMNDELSTVARRGSASAARAMVGGFANLYAGMDDWSCHAERIDTPLDDTDIRVIAGVVPAYKETEAAHEEAEDSHMFQARLAHVHEQLAKMRSALSDGDFDRVFSIAEHDSLSLAATTMTGPSGWVYWKPKTLSIFNTVRELRDQSDIPVYFSTDTGATVYVNTLAEYADEVEDAVNGCGVDTYRWKVGGGARKVDDDALF